MRQRSPAPFTLSAALANLSAGKKRFATIFERGMLQLEIYAPRGVDPQKPHERDELYVVVSGSGFFVNGERRDPFGPGDALFAPAGAVHRFEDFSDDFVTWVLFYGPEGGEKGPPMNGSALPP